MHLQELATVLATGELVLTGHALHCTSDPAPTNAEYVAVGHTVHTLFVTEAN